MFDISKDFKLILEEIVGLFIIDCDERIVYMNDGLAKRHGFSKGFEVTGKKIHEIIPKGVNNLYKIIQSGKEQIGQIYYFEGEMYVSNGFPIYKDGNLIGALEYDTFGSAAFLQSFLKKLNEMSSELDFYKTEYSSIKGTKYSIEDILGESMEIEHLKDRITNVAKSQSTVLIEGETGCGKELVAHAIHSSSQRILRNFIKINCSTIPENLFESELFGYEEGSFTDAKVGGKRGKAELASGGTLFFDEVDQLSLSEQPKLLRFLQEKEISKIGGEEGIYVDVRVVAATNKDLFSLVQQGKFREDLYYRLTTIEVAVPPLRKRKEDINILVTSIIDNLNKELRSTQERVNNIDDDVINLLKTYSWPGNVRELQNVIENAFYECNGDSLKAEHFEDFFVEKAIYESDFAQTSVHNLTDIRNEAEKSAIISTLEYCKGNKSKTCKILNMSRTMLYQKLEKYEI